MTTLPEPLQRAIDDALAFVRRHPMHDLNPGYRKAIYRALGPRLDVDDPREARQLAGYRRRAVLEIITVRQVVPYWKYVYAGEEADLASALLREAEDVLETPAIWRTVLNEPSQTAAYLERIDVHAAWDGFDGVARIASIGHAASRAHTTALFDMNKRWKLEQAHKGSSTAIDAIDYEATNNDSDPYSSDAALLTLYAYAGVPGPQQYAFEVARQREFWEWWLTRAVPQAWELVGEDGRIAERWKDAKPADDVLFLSQLFARPKTLASLPSALRQEIETALHLVRDDPGHDLPAAQCQRLADALAVPPEDTAHELQSGRGASDQLMQRIGAARWAILAFFAVSNMETIWYNCPAVRTLPRRILMDVERTLFGTLPWRDALTEVESTWSTVRRLYDDFVEQRRDDEGGTLIAFAACTALLDAARAAALDANAGSDGGEPPTPGRISDEASALLVTAPGTCDVARLALLAYTAYGGAEDDSKNAKRLDFWVWWLTQALPAAWVAVNQNGQFLNEWRQS